LWHLVLCGHVIGEFTVQPQQFLVYRVRDRPRHLLVARHARGKLDDDT
jgi:hypothetical protein